MQTATLRQRRKVARISQFEVAASAPQVTTLIAIKRKVAAIDALARATQLTHANTLNATSDWGRLFYGCEADKLRGRCSIYRRRRDELVALLAALTAIIP